MSFDTNWNVDKYKSEFESEEHWKLRKNFMLAHKTKFPEARLACLAQVFFNVEFLGCRYPEETMKLIKELSEDIAADHREQQKNKLQRTFVKASDAAGAKIKGVKHPTQSYSNVSTKKQSCLPPEDSTNYIEDTAGNKFLTSLLNIANRGCGSISSNTKVQQQKSSNTLYNNFVVKSTGTTIEEIKQTSGPFGNVVVFYEIGEHPNSTLQRFANQWKLEYQRTTEKQGPNLWKAVVSFNNIEAGKATDVVKSAALLKASQIALEKLMETYFTVKIKCKFWGNTVVNTSGNNDKTKPVSLNSKQSAGLTDSIKQSDINEPMDADNVGSRLLKMMGWTGGGLGKNEQGIVEPIKPSATSGRAGFGNNLSTPNDLAEINRVKTLIVKYKKSNNYDDLVFSAAFSKEQRQQFHQFAQTRNLKTKSFGKGDQRHLVVSKKINIWSIIEGLVKESDQLYNKYELLRPGTKVREDAD